MLLLALSALGSTLLSDKAPLSMNVSPFDCDCLENLHSIVAFQWKAVGACVFLSYKSTLICAYELFHYGRVAHVKWNNP